MGNINCLWNIPFSSEWQQSDPNAGSDSCPLSLRHYRVSRPSHQLLSWLNKGSVVNVLRQQRRSVSWSFFRPWAVSCRCAAFWKALTRSIVPTVLIDAISFEESSAATLTLTWSKNTRKVQVQGPWQCWTGPRSNWSNSFKLTVRIVSQRRVSLRRGVVSARLRCCGACKE